MLLFDASERVLLLRGHDPAEPHRSWWFTPGGGIDGDETARQAAARELREETGWDIPEERLVGPVWERTALFDFMEHPYAQHEVFYVARIPGAPDDAVAPGGRLGWTAAERDTLDDVRWFSVAEVVGLDTEVFPTTLGELLPGALDWDGELRQLGEERA